MRPANKMAQLCPCSYFFDCPSSPPGDGVYPPYTGADLLCATGPTPKALNPSVNSQPPASPFSFALGAGDESNDILQPKARVQSPAPLYDLDFAWQFHGELMKELYGKGQQP